MRRGTLALAALLLAAIVVRPAASSCVVESDFGFNVNCALKKSGLFRVRNLGGVKAHIGVGFSVGDELGFKESLSNVESNRRRIWPGSKAHVQMIDVLHKRQASKEQFNTIGVLRKRHDFGYPIQLVGRPFKKQDFKAQAQMVEVLHKKQPNKALNEIPDALYKKQMPKSPAKVAEMLRRHDISVQLQPPNKPPNVQVSKAQDHLVNVLHKRQGVSPPAASNIPLQPQNKQQKAPVSKAQDHLVTALHKRQGLSPPTVSDTMSITVSAKMAGNLNESVHQRQGKNSFMTRAIPSISVVDPFRAGVPPPPRVFQPQVQAAARRNDLLFAAIPPFKPIPPAAERPNVDLKGNSKSDVPTPTVVGVALPSYSKRPGSISRVSPGHRYQSVDQVKKPEVMAVVVPIKRKATYNANANDRLSSTDFALRTLASPNNELLSPQGFHGATSQQAAAHTLKNFLAANNITEEMLETALLQRQQQLLAQARLKTTTTTTTPRPTITRPRNPSSSVGKVMNAPREYYPVGYDKNFDDNFASRVELPETSFYCGDQKHFPGLYADEDLGCMVFHVCALTDDGLITKSFLCPESTLFDQAILKCNWWFYVDCKNSKKLYDSNIPVSKSYQLMKALTFFSGYKKEAAKPSEKD